MGGRRGPDGAARLTGGEEGAERVWPRPQMAHLTPRVTYRTRLADHEVLDLEGAEDVFEAMTRGGLLRGLRRYLRGRAAAASRR